MGPIMNEAQRQAQEKLDQAIREHAAAFRPASEIHPGAPSQMVTDWMYVANVIWWDEDGDKMSAYNVGYVNGELEEHRAIGLLTIGSKIVMGDGMEMKE